MASAAAAIEQAATPKRVDESLWWDSFLALLDELESADSPSAIPESLVKKLESNRKWFLDPLSFFKPLNDASRLALDSDRISVGPHEMRVNAELKEAALRASSIVNLDEVQSYILASRSSASQSVVDCRETEVFDLIIVQYYLERQCLLKCVREVVTRALHVEDQTTDKNAVRDEAFQLLHSGIDDKLLQILHDLLLATFPEKSEGDITTMWVEETLVEISLVLDILFIAYYGNLCTFCTKTWRKFCEFFKGILNGSFSIGKLAVSSEARSSLYHVKVQILLILVETIQLDKLLKGIFDEASFSECCSIFSVSDILDLNKIVSSLVPLEAVEVGPLLLAWATFICLVLSFPNGLDCSMHMEVDHVGYVRCAVELAPFNYILEVLSFDLSKESEGPLGCYLDVLRTFMAAFMASYEVPYQLGDGTLTLILEILTQIYRGEENLCVQFWDKESCIDGPIRSLLYFLESNFPFHKVEFIRLLSSLCDGPWPAECVYNFLDNMGGISLPFEIHGTVDSLSAYDIVQAPNSLYIPGVEGIAIPSGTRGQILKVLDPNTLLVRWQHAQSGVLTLVLQLMHGIKSSSYEELYCMLDLLYRLVSFNKSVCFGLLQSGKSLTVRLVNGHAQQSVRVDVVKVLCNLVSCLGNDLHNASLVSITINILAEMVKCLPSYVCEVTQGANLFGVRDHKISDTWLLSGGLARLIMSDCEHSDGCPLTISVLDYTIVLMDVGSEDNLVSSLITFCVHYVLVNHENWKYKLKYFRWIITLKAFEVMKKCVEVMACCRKNSLMIQNILFGDPSVYNAISRLLCITHQTLEGLYVSRLCELKEVEYLQLAVQGALDILSSMLNELLKMEIISSAPGLVRSMLSTTDRPVSAFAGTISLISFSRDPMIQIGACRVISHLFLIFARLQAYSSEQFSVAMDDVQLRDLVATMVNVLKSDGHRNVDLVIAAVDLLISVAYYQPALCLSVMSFADTDVPHNHARDASQLSAPTVSFLDTKRVKLVGEVLQCISNSGYLIKSCPSLLLHILKLLKAIWEGGSLFVPVLDTIRNSKMFWGHLATVLSSIVTEADFDIKCLDPDQILSFAYRLQCQAAVLEIVACDIFLFGKNFDKITSENQTSVVSKETPKKSIQGAKDVLLSLIQGNIGESLVKMYSFGDYRRKAIYSAKMALNPCLVHLMAKLSEGDTGSVSISLVNQIRSIANKLCDQPAFHTLLEQYAFHRYSKEDDDRHLILNDLYYHLDGELEGREITPGLFKDLVRYLSDLDFFSSTVHQHGIDPCLYENDVYMFDLPCFQVELRTEFWDHSSWRVSKPVVSRALQLMHEANLSIVLSQAKHVALKAFLAIISVPEKSVVDKNCHSLAMEISKPIFLSSIKYLCECLHDGEEIFISAMGPSEAFLKHHVSRIDLLHALCTSLFKHDALETDMEELLPMCIHVIKTAAASLRCLSDNRQSSNFQRRAVKLFLMLLLTSVEFLWPGDSRVISISETELFAELSLLFLGLLPVLCKFLACTECCNLSTVFMDLILKRVLTPKSWVPVLQKHLNIQFLINKLQERNMKNVLIILRFLLTLAQTEGGAQMLLSSKYFFSLKFIFDFWMHEESVIDSDSQIISCKNIKDDDLKNVCILGMAIVTSVVLNAADDSSEIVSSAISYFFLENSSVLYQCLSAPCFINDDHGKKRPRMQNAQRSLTALREVEHIFMLICALAKHRASWAKGMAEHESQLREACIHMLSFISRGNHRAADLPNRLLFCHPTLKEEVKANERAAFVGCKSGWFAPSCLAISKPMTPAIASAGLPLAIKSSENGRDKLFQQSYFSDMVAIQLYKIAFLLLNFLCIQAKSATKRAEDVQFIDLDRFPELPRPEILHGIQDQAIRIVIEICRGNKSNAIQQETRTICLLLVQILEKSLYLELCVLKSCGLRPVFGRIEDFSKGIKTLMDVAEEHAFLKASLRSLRQIVGPLYPGLVPTNTLA